MVRTFLVAAAGAIIGAALLWLFEGHSIRLVPESMSYADLAATMLGAAGILLTGFGLLIGVLALWGYSQFRSMAENAAVEHVRTSVAGGDLKSLVTDVSEKFIQSELEQGRLRKILEDRIDAVLVKGPSAREREEEPGGGDDEFNDGNDNEQP